MKWSIKSLVLIAVVAIGGLLGTGAGKADAYVVYRGGYRVGGYSYGYSRPYYGGYGYGYARPSYGGYYGGYRSGYGGYRGGYGGYGYRGGYGGYGYRGGYGGFRR